MTRDWYKIAAAFLRLPEVRLVGLKDACYTLGLVPNDRLKEPVSPLESGTDRHIRLLGRLPDGQTLLQALTVQKKLFLRVKVVVDRPEKRQRTAS
jgi:hypothetical protein